MGTRTPQINRTVLMSDANYFSVKELNLYSNEKNQPDMTAAQNDHNRVKAALEKAGVRVIQKPSPIDCQDGIYTANWAFCRGDIAVLARLPNVRQGEEMYAKKILEQQGKRVVVPPKSLRYSGQGDTLICGDTLFVGQYYRSDPEMTDFLADLFPDLKVVGIQTVPAVKNGREIINKISGWPDSLFYDIDLAMGVVRPDLIAWCPEAFLPESREKIAALSIEKIEIDYKEATKLFASNFVSTGSTVVMGMAPKLEASLKAKGLETITLQTKEINKGGGFIRCVSLTLDN